MPIDLKSIEQEISRRKYEVQKGHEEIKSDNKPEITEKSPMPPTNSVRPTSYPKPVQSKSLSRSKPSQPLKITCPLAPVENCVYGFFTSLCCHCQSWRFILDNIPFPLPDDCKVVENIKENFKEECFEEFVDRLKIFIDSSECRIQEFIDKILEKIEEKNEELLKEMSSQQLEIIRALILLKDESVVSTLVWVILGAAEKMIDVFEQYATD